MMQIQIKPFDQLSLKELYDILSLRCEVFVVEQNCPYQDLDRKDQMAYHLTIYENDLLLGYARLFEPGAVYKEVAIGRVVTSPNSRHLKLGHRIMKESIDFAESFWKTTSIKLSAQSHLEGFYAKHGFVSTGKNYLEDDIPHTEMVRY